jgi:cysteine desulfurase
MNSGGTTHHQIRRRSRRNARKVRWVTTIADAEISTNGQSAPGRPVYLDCNATTPVEPEVLAEVMRFMAEEYGNAASRTHQYGQTAKERVNLARSEVADVVACKPDEVIFTSGATESNNIALLGLASHGDATGRKHLISTMIEHKAVLEPLEALQHQGFEVTLLRPTSGGYVEPEAVAAALRPDTLAVSVMAINNETGVIQPIPEVSQVLADHDAYFHVDGAQAFGKDLHLLRDPRIDLLSISGHKIYAPKGIGALVTRRRGYKRPPLQPIMHGGGHERGLRPGTLPVPLVAGLGTAARLAVRDHGKRVAACAAFRKDLLEALTPLYPVFNGTPELTVPHVTNMSIPGIDAEAAMVAVKDLVAISNGSACTSNSYEPSHVLVAMGLTESVIQGSLRISWSHLTQAPRYEHLIMALRNLQQSL